MHISNELKERKNNIDEASSLPEVITRPNENEKQVAVICQKELAASSDKQAIDPFSDPEAIDSEGDKECVDRRFRHASSKGRLSYKSWKDAATARFCQVMMLVVVVLIVIGAVVGGVVGSRSSNDNASLASATPTLYDASFIATPTSTSPPTGTFGLDLGSPVQTQSSCLTKPGEQAAWSCDLVYGAQLDISVGFPANSASSGASLTFAGEADYFLKYGAQAAAMDTTFSPFLLVSDNDDSQYGPAYYFQSQYDKLVIVPDNDLAQIPHANRDNSTTGAVPRGDTCWLCYWNETLVEGFIYANKTAQVATTTTTQPSTSSEASLTLYPYLVKLEERRLPGSPRPYCLRVQVLDDLNWNFVADTGIERTKIELTEHDPSYSAYQQAGFASSSKMRLARDEVPGACNCEWMSGL